MPAPRSASTRKQIFRSSDSANDSADDSANDSANRNASAATSKSSAPRQCQTPHDRAPHVASSTTFITASTRHNPFQNRSGSFSIHAGSLRFT